MGSWEGTSGLSRREQLILSLAGEGLADKEIAIKIGISMGTVRTYWQRMRDKTNARSRSEILSLCLHTSHSQTVNELERLKNRFSALVEASGVGLALLDGQEIAEVNSAFAELVGRNTEDLVGSTLDDVDALKALNLGTGAEAPVFAHNGGGITVQILRQPVDLEGRTYHVLTLIPIARVPDYGPAIVML